VECEAAKRQKQAKEQMGAEGKGYHRTPAFIHTVTIDVLRAAAAGREKPHKTMPQGGFTDVGQHTGIIAPNTSWPLVRESLKVCATAG
jgi:hypothetical protein